MRSPLATALLNPLNLAMPVLAVLAGLLAAWWLLPLGLVLWAIMVATIANDKSLRINYNMEARLGTLPSRFQDPYSKAVRAQMRVFNSLLNVGGENRRALEPVESAVEALVDKVYELCQQMTAPENYLSVSQGKNADLEGQRALLVLSIDKDMDPTIKQQKEAAIKELEGRIQKTKGLAAALEHVEAQLTSTTTLLETLPAEIMRLQVMGVAQIRQEVPVLLAKLKQESDQVQACEGEVAQQLA
jgi:hypothetical protein